MTALLPNLPPAFVLIKLVWSHIDHEQRCGTGVSSLEEKSWDWNLLRRLFKVSHSSLKDWLWCPVNMLSLCCHFSHMIANRIIKCSSILSICSSCTEWRTPALISANWRLTMLGNVWECPVRFSGWTHLMRTILNPRRNGCRCHLTSARDSLPYHCLSWLQGRWIWNFVRGRLKLQDLTQIL